MRMLLIVAILSALGAQQPAACPNCPDPSRPWMRCEPPGCPERSCAHPAMIEAMNRERPGRELLACECRHTCDPENEQAGVTDGRGWDAICLARCNPSNCQCPHPCDS